MADETTKIPRWVIAIGSASLDRLETSMRKSSEGFLDPDCAFFYGDFGIFGVGVVEEGGEGHWIGEWAQGKCLFSCQLLWSDKIVVCKGYCLRFALTRSFASDMNDILDHSRCE